jgi:hypothetical protein
MRGRFLNGAFRAKLDRPPSHIRSDANPMKRTKPHENNSIYLGYPQLPITGCPQ